MPASKKTIKSGANKAKSTSQKPKAGRTTKSTSRSSQAKTSPKQTLQPQSFHIYKDTTPFLTYKITRQTVYWLILSLAVIGLGLWTIYIHQQVQEIYDQIDETQRQQVQLDERELEILRQQYDK